MVWCCTRISVLLEILAPVGGWLALLTISHYLQTKSWENGETNGENEQMHEQAWKNVHTNRGDERTQDGGGVKTEIRTGRDKRIHEQNFCVTELQTGRL